MYYCILIFKLRYANPHLSLLSENKFITVAKEKAEKLPTLLPFGF
jgi:hypothetical protein